MRTPSLAVLLAAAVLAAPPAPAEPLGPGGALPAITLADQHGALHTLDASLRLVVLTRDMDAGGIVRELLEKEGAAWLERQSAVYIADVSRMPGVIRAAIAKPRMRRRPYPILLDESGKETVDFPSAGKQATLIFVKGLRIERVEHVGSAEALGAAVGGAAPPTAAPGS